MAANPLDDQDMNRLAYEMAAALRSIDLVSKARKADGALMLPVGDGDMRAIDHMEIYSATAVAAVERHGFAFADPKGRMRLTAAGVAAGDAFLAAETGDAAAAAEIRLFRTAANAAADQLRRAS